MSRRKSLFMENTAVPADKTRGQVCALIAQFPGITEISQQLDDGKVVGFKFTMSADQRILIFQLPVRTSRVVKQLMDRRKTQPYDDEIPGIEKKGERIAWRQTMRWLEAQLAMVDTGLADVAEVFMPYVLGIDGTTFYERWRGNLLAAAEGEEADD